MRLRSLAVALAVLASVLATPAVADDLYFKIYRVVNGARTGACLSADAFDLVGESDPCPTEPKALWAIVSLPGGRSKLRNKLTNRFLDLDPGVAADNFPLVNLHENRIGDSSYQEWIMTSAGGDGFVYLVNQQTHRYLTHAKSNTHVDVFNADRSGFTQRWKFDAVIG